MSNAQEADPTGGVTWVVQPPIAGQLTVSIHKGGEPIAPERLPKLTQPFFATKASGNGLGLTITKRSVEVHPGQLTLTAADTEVRVTLPQVGTGLAT